MVLIPVGSGDLLNQWVQSKWRLCRAPISLHPLLFCSYLFHFLTEVEIKSPHLPVIDGSCKAEHTESKQ